MNSAHTHSRCRGAPCPHHMFSHLPFLLCSEPQNISSTIFPSVHLSSLSFSFSLLPSLLPPSLSGTPCGSSHPVPRSTPTVPLYPGHDEAAVPAAPRLCPASGGDTLAASPWLTFPTTPSTAVLLLSSSHRKGTEACTANTCPRSLLVWVGFDPSLTPEPPFLTMSCLDSPTDLSSCFDYF